MIKAVFLDIDGTLVPFGAHKAPDSTLQALREARSRGVKVFICTGRPLQFIDNLEGVDYDGMVCVTGSLCCLANGEVIYRNRIPAADIQRLVDFVNQQDEPTPFMAVTDDSLHIIHPEHPFVQYIVDMLHIPAVSYAPFQQVVNKPVLQLMGFYGPEQNAVFESLMPSCSFLRWHPMFADIVFNQCSKADGIDHMLAHFGISLEETMAIGDGGNDISMLEHVAYGVAMGNAAPEVQQCARFVTRDVTDDGIAHAFRHFGVI